MKLTWYGQSFFEVETGSTVALIDPFMEGNPMNDVEPGDFDPDVIAITHGHADHIAEAHRFDAPVVGQPEVTGYMAKKGHDDAVGMNIGGSYDHGDLTFTATKAFHSSGAPDEGDYDFPAGTPIGYVIDDGSTKFYHAGDTGLFGDMKTVIRDVLAPDVAAVPIGDRHTMGPDLAGIAVGWLGVDAAIPMHYDTFPFIEQDPQDFADAVDDAEVVVPDVGEAVEF